MLSGKKAEQIPRTESLFQYIGFQSVVTIFEVCNKTLKVLQTTVNTVSEVL